MPVSTSYLFSGTVYGLNRSTASANAIIKVINRTTSNPDFTVVANGSGQFTIDIVDLANGYNNGDMIEFVVTDSDGNYTGYWRAVVNTENEGEEFDLYLMNEVSPDDFRGAVDRDTFRFGINHANICVATSNTQLIHPIKSARFVQGSLTIHNDTASTLTVYIVCSNKRLPGPITDSTYWSTIGSSAQTVSANSSRTLAWRTRAEWVAIYATASSATTGDVHANLIMVNG